MRARRGLNENIIIVLGARAALIDGLRIAVSREIVCASTPEKTNPVCYLVRRPQKIDRETLKKRFNRTVMLLRTTFWISYTIIYFQSIYGEGVLLRISEDGNIVKPFYSKTNLRYKLKYKITVSTAVKVLHTINSDGDTTVFVIYDKSSNKRTMRKAYYFRLYVISHMKYSRIGEICNRCCRTQGLLGYRCQQFCFPKEFIQKNIIFFFALAQLGAIYITR